MSCESTSGLAQFGRCCQSVCPQHAGLVPIADAGLDQWCFGDVPFHSNSPTTTLSGWNLIGGQGNCGVEAITPFSTPSRLMYGTYEWEIRDYGGTLLYQEPNLSIFMRVVVALVQFPGGQPSNSVYQVIKDYDDVRTWAGSGSFVIPCSSDYLGIAFNITAQTLLNNTDPRFIGIRVRRIEDSMAP